MIAARIVLALCALVVVWAMLCLLPTLSENCFSHQPFAPRDCAMPVE
jgi:hypothetical protein